MRDGPPTERDEISNRDSITLSNLHSSLPHTQNNIWI